MKSYLLLSVFFLVTSCTFAQSNTKQYIANEINELLFSNVDSSLNEIINVDKYGQLNIMYKTVDENVDFNILDISNIELNDPDNKNPYLTIVFHCNRCMHLTSPWDERRAKFENSNFTLPVKYKALGMKMISKLNDLKKQFR